MRYRPLSGLILFLLIIAGCAAQMQENAPRVESTGTVNLRSGPGLDYQIIALIPKGTSLILLDSTNDWQRVHVSDRLEGWVSKKYTRMAGYEQVRITTQTKVRSGPGEDHKAFAILLQGRTFSIIGEKDNWYHVVLPDGNMGWISSRDAQKVRYTNITTTQETIVRESPDFNSRHVIQVEKGRKLTQMDRKGAWYHVQIGTGLLGWIHENAVKPVPEKTNILVSEEANIRKGPSTMYEIVDIVDASTKLTELKKKGDWYKVKTPTGTTGWIDETKIRKGTTQRPSTPTQKPSPPATQQDSKYNVRPEYMITRQDCNIRQGYSTNFPVLTRAKEGTIVLKIGRKSNWSRFKYPPDGRIGWIRNDLVKSSGDIFFTNQDCNIRQGYGTNFSIIRRVPAGTVLSRIERKDDWFRVYMPDGQIGWILNSLTTSEKYIFINNQDCNVRSGPGTNHSIIHRQKAGQIVSRKENRNNWMRVQMENGNKGWIQRDLLASTDQYFEVFKYANLYNSNNESGGIAGSLPAGNKVYQTKSKGDWLQVRIHPIGIGWVKKDQLLPAYLGIDRLSFSQANSGSDPEHKTLTTIQPTNIRSGPGLEYDVSIRVRTGTLMIVLSKKGEWFRVKLASGLVGYVHYSVFLNSNNTQDNDGIASQPLYTNSATTIERVKPQEEKVYAKIDLNVRAMPDSNSAKISRLRANTELKKIDQRLNWTQVKLSDGKKGWIFTPLLSAIPSSKPTKAVVANNPEILYSSRAINVRVSPDSTSRRLIRLSANTGLKKLGQQNNWTRIQLKDGRYGWVFSPLLTSAPEKKVPALASSDLKTTAADIILEQGILRTKHETVIRTGPANNYQILLTVPQDTRLIKSKKTKDWYYVEYEKNKFGYVAFDHVEDVADHQIIVVERADVRKSREIAAESVFTVLPGTVLNASQELNGWFRVENSGWIRSNHVRAVKYPVMLASGNISVRRSPSADAKKVTSLKSGDELKPLREKRGWLFIELFGGLSGWIRSTDVYSKDLPRIKSTANAGVYDSPSIQSKKITTLANGAVFTPAARRGEWFKIRLNSNGAYGWIAASDYELALTAKMRVTGQTFVREGPGIEYRVVETAVANDELSCTKTQGGWCLVVTSSKKIGWVNSQFTTPVSFNSIITVRETPVRNGPEESAYVLERVADNSQLIPLSERSGWYEVKLENGTTGWVRKSDFEQNLKPRIVFTLDLCEIRSGPGTDFSMIKRVDPATDLTIIGEKNDWYKVKAERQNLEGWIKKDQVFE